MSNQQVISYADLSIINSALRSISKDISGVNSELGTLNFKQDQLESELVKLSDAFVEFVKADLKHKALQLAETRQGNLKQDLQIKFGYYAEVRRMATGILQSADIGVVSDETLKYTTEEVMIKAPGYWLASALVSLAAWIRNEKYVNEKALNEALKRDDYKTTLFFMLVMRRFARNEASLKWLERYFMHQNPNNLDREFIIILEAVTTGVFPPAHGLRADRSAAVDARRLGGPAHRRAQRHVRRGRHLRRAVQRGRAPSRSSRQSRRPRV